MQQPPPIQAYQPRTQRRSNGVPILIASISGIVIACIALIVLLRLIAGLDDLADGKLYGIQKFAEAVSELGTYAVVCLFVAYKMLSRPRV